MYQYCVIFVPVAVWRFGQGQTHTAGYLLTKRLSLCRGVCGVLRFAVELPTGQDRESGVGAFYDEEGCALEQQSRSVVGCNLGG